MNYRKIIKIVQKKFGGKWKFLLRLHPNIASKSHELNLPKEVIDVSAYDDMQELLLCSDILIVDYSSSIFDYLLTNRPCFMYANDFEEYKKDRDLYFELKDLPFSYALNQNELNDNILSFNQEDFTKKNLDFQKRFGYKEKGHATESVTDWLIEKADL